MTPEQRRAIAIAKRLAERLGRRPTGRELYQRQVTFGATQAFRNLHALLVAADLAVPASRNLAGFTLAEERIFERLWEAGEATKAMATALGVMPRILTNEIHDRRMTRAIVRRKKSDPLILTRRCQNPVCGQITEGAGPCRHCGADGLTNAA